MRGRRFINLLSPLGVLGNIPAVVFKDFATADTTTVSRTASATYFNSAKVLSTAAANVARIQCDGLTGERLGLLIEDSTGSNLERWSTDYSQSQWGKSATTVTTDTNEVTDPAGGNTADILFETATTANHQASQTQTFSALAVDTMFTEYRVVRARDRSRFKFIGPTGQVVFDCTTGEVDAQFSTIGTSDRARAYRLANGWLLCVFQFLLTAGNTGYTCNLRLINDAAQTTSYLGDVTKGIYLWQAEGRSGAVFDMPIFTVFPQGTRDQDVATQSISSWWNASGYSFLLEGRSQQSDGQCIVAQIDDGTESNRVRFWRDASGEGRLLVTAAGSQAANVDLGSWQNDTDRAVAVSIAGTQLRYSMNGSAEQTVTLSAAPTGLTTARYGLDTSGIGPNMIVRQSGLYNGVMPAGQKRRFSLKRPSQSLCFYGDSISAGGVTGQTPGYNYPSQLGRLMNRRIFNAGIGSQTSPQIAARFLADLDHLNWVILLDAGRNDGSDLVTILAQTAQMVGHMPSNARFGVVPIPFATGDPQATKDYIAANNAALLAAYPNNFMTGVDWSQITRVFDAGVGLHPDDAGNATLAGMAQTFVTTKGW